jgi:UDP-2,3-diacylglucosamine hydrolase
VLIHGHTHRPAVHEQLEGRRYVLGDWETQGWYLRLSAGVLTLHSFDIADVALTGRPQGGPLT